MKQIRQTKEDKTIIADKTGSAIKESIVAVPKLSVPDPKTGTIVKIIFLKDLKSFKQGKEIMMEWSIAKALEKKGIVEILN